MKTADNLWETLFFFLSFFYKLKDRCLCISALYLFFNDTVSFRVICKELCTEEILKDKPECIVALNCLCTKKKTQVFVFICTVYINLTEKGIVPKIYQHIPCGLACILIDAKLNEHFRVAVKYAAIHAWISYTVSLSSIKSH